MSCSPSSARSVARRSASTKFRTDWSRAFLAGEDNRFFVHPGVDWQSLTRAVLYLVRTGEKGPGGNTITMQVARTFFLSREKTYIRKLNEILLTLKEEARDAPVTAKVHGLAIEVEAPYVAEMVRAHMEETYGDDVHPA